MTPAERKQALWFLIIASIVMVAAVIVTLCIVCPGQTGAQRRERQRAAEPDIISGKKLSDLTAPSTSAQSEQARQPGPIDPPPAAATEIVKQNQPPAKSGPSAKTQPEQPKPAKYPLVVTFALNRDKRQMSSYEESLMWKVTNMGYEVVIIKSVTYNRGGITDVGQWELPARRCPNTKLKPGEYTWFENTEKGQEVLDIEIETDHGRFTYDVRPAR
ncbi:MAG: hypothetical protein PHU85_12475 [Phycisphaerae bacterium]|nr:hypothetical protein [Phycisphaerae bacterium]